MLHLLIVKRLESLPLRLYAIFDLLVSGNTARALFCENVPDLVRIPLLFAWHGREGALVGLPGERLIRRLQVLLKVDLLRLGRLEFSIHGTRRFLVAQDLALGDLFRSQELAVGGLAGLIN